MIKLSIKEKAGVPDASRTNEGIHKHEEFLKNLADNKKRKNMGQEIIENGERHINACPECRRKFERFKNEPKEQELPLEN